MSKCLFEFNEFGEGMGFPSIKDFCLDDAYPGKDKIIKYLNNGKKTYASTAKAQDVITGNRLDVELYGMTDGEYSWLSTISYYVDKYNLRLPKEFENKVLNISN